MFHVGQKVTPIDGGDWGTQDGSRHSEGPEFGKVYEIIHAYRRPIPKHGDVLFLVFAEFPYRGWDADDFRPLTDISVFTDMLVSVPTPIPAEPVAQSVPGLCLGG